MVQKQSSLAGTLLWGSAAAIALFYAWTNIPMICANENCTSFITAEKYFGNTWAKKNALLNPILVPANVSPPVIEGSCEEMEDYFNKEFGRKDTAFSNYEGRVDANLLGELYCDGGVVIQSLPTAKKTCSAAILYNPQTQGLRWYTENAIASCFVSQ
jgi:hypothetical protein